MGKSVAIGHEIIFPKELPGTEMAGRLTGLRQRSADSYPLI